MSELFSLLGHQVTPDDIDNVIFGIGFSLGSPLLLWGLGMAFYGLINYQDDRETYFEVAGWSLKWGCLFLILAGVWTP